MSLALGLISGTSMDGVDAALVECGEAPDAHPRLLEFRTYPYDSSLRAGLGDLVAGGGLARLARLNVVVGEVFAQAALALLEEAGTAPSEVECIGSHGQTVIHLPRPTEIAGRPVRATLQIGEPAVIAARTGVLTVADFRPMDLALGGQGAPLVPLLDWRLYGHPDRHRLLLNLGGIANVTDLPAGAGLEEVRAFDTGPANVLLDSAARRRGLPDDIDRGGEVAAAGRTDPALFEHLGRNPFLSLAPPKSADAAELIGWLDDAEPVHDELSTADLLATLARHTGASVVEAVDRWFGPRDSIDEVLVSGGGVHNRTLMGELERGFDSLPVGPVPIDTGVTADAKEAVAFALLAHETLAGRAGNVPSATGASRRAVLGKIIRPLLAGSR